LKACNRSAVRVSAWCLAALVAACFATVAQAQVEAPAGAPSATTHTAATQPASAPATQPAQPISPDELPAADSFKARDKSGDEGNAIVIAWARPAKESPDTTYVVEIARRPEDFANSELYKHKDVLVLPAKLGNLYQTEITPCSDSDQFFPLPKPPELTLDRLKKLADEGALTAEEYARAKGILEIENRKPTTAPASSPATAASTQPAATTAPVAATGSASQPATATGPTSQAKPAGGITHEDKDWMDNLKEYADGRDFLKGVNATDKYLLSDQDLVRALAAWASEFREEATDQAKSEQDWMDRLMAFLKKKDQEQQKTRKLEINGSPWYFRLAVERDDQKSYVSEQGQPKVLPASAHTHWFRWGKLNNLVFSLVFCIIVGVFIQVAKRRPNLFIRKIGGLEAVDEAIGRSTEMDKPVFFVHGLGSVGDLATMASINILGRVATRAAEHDSRVKVMNSDPIVTAVSQEVVQQSYMQAGRPDAFNADDVSMVASDQFSYVAAVSGRMVREQPGAIFLLGSFAAESLLLAETGASTGAIQVAGTDAYTQLPFFITTCDYTLIGEELYAASAYLSREPKLLGSLRGQDVGKAFLMIVIVVVSVLLTVGVAIGANWDWLRKIFVASMD
jgi:hypothetical protein